MVTIRIEGFKTRIEGLRMRIDRLCVVEEEILVWASDMELRRTLHIFE